MSLRTPLENRPWIAFKIATWPSEKFLQEFLSFHSEFLQKILPTFIQVCIPKKKQSQAFPSEFL